MAKKNGIILTVIVTLALAAMTATVGFATFNNHKLQEHAVSTHAITDQRFMPVEDHIAEIKDDVKDIKTDIRTILIRLGGSASE